MAGTYTQTYMQIVFAVKYREKIILKSWRHRLYEYIAAILKNQGHKSIIVNGVEDHIHILIGMNASVSLSDTVRTIKSNSSKFINENKLVTGKFSWQEGYGAFSYSRSSIETVYNYILNQEEHHRSKSFKEEYISFMKESGLEYEEKYLFDEERDECRPLGA